MDAKLNKLTSCIGSSPSLLGQIGKHLILAAVYSHGARYPTGGDEDGINNENFAAKVVNFTQTNPQAFSGPLAFLNTYSYQLGRSLLVPSGAAQEYLSGVNVRPSQLGWPFASAFRLKVSSHSFGTTMVASCTTPALVNLITMLLSPMARLELNPFYEPHLKVVY